MARSLKGRGFVSDTPVYEGGVAGAAGAAPPRPAAAPQRGGGQGKSKGDQALRNYLAGKAYGGNSLPEEIAILSVANKVQGAGGFTALDYQGSKGPRSYYPVIREGETLQTAVARVSENTGLSPDEVLQQLGGPEQAQTLLANNQHLAGSHHMGIVGSAGKAVRGVGADLLSEEAETRAMALRAAGIEEDALRSRYATQLPADAGLPEWMPRMNNLTPVQTGMAYGLAAAGMGAAGVALANHLMAKGQQQSDPVHYAAAMQALNAYA